MKLVAFSSYVTYLLPLWLSDEHIYRYLTRTSMKFLVRNGVWPERLDDTTQTSVDERLELLSSSGGHFSCHEADSTCWYNWEGLYHLFYGNFMSNKRIKQTHLTIILFFSHLSEIIRPKFVGELHNHKIFYLVMLIIKWTR